MTDDPLRDAAGRFRAPTPAERFGLAIAAPPEPPVPGADPAPEPPRRGPLIPAGPMGDGDPGGDLIRAALRRLNRH